MEDSELEKIKKKQLEELLQQQNLNKIVNEMPVMELTSQDFDQKKSENELLLVDFWAEWCGPCRMVGPIIDELSNENEGKAIIAKLDVDANQIFAAKYGVRNIPTVLLFKDGEMISRQVGVAPKQTYQDAINSAL